MKRKLKFFGKTYIGRRSNNEDKYFAGKITDDLYFFAIADGMGGAVSGEIASALVIEKALAVMKEEAPLITTPEELKDTLLRIYLIAQSSIKERIEKEPMLNGMGSTLVTLIIYKENYVYGNLGDCRLYKIDNEKIVKLTEDHTYVEDFLKNNGNTLPESILNQYGNYLMKSLDGGKDEPDIFPKDKPCEILSNNTVFILCSDGLILDKTSSDDQKISDIIISNKKLDKAVNNLVLQAFKDGSKDNITAIVAEYGTVKRVNVIRDKNKIKDSDKHKIGISNLSWTLLVAVFSVIIILSYFIFNKYNSVQVPVTQLEQSDTISNSLDNKDIENSFVRNKGDNSSYNKEIKWHPFQGSADVSFNFEEKLKWNPMPDAEKYSISIWQSGNKVRSITTEKLTFDLSSLSPGRYKIIMIAQRKNGTKFAFNGFLSIRKK